MAVRTQRIDGRSGNSEEVEAGLGTLTVKTVDSEKVEAGLGTCSQKVVDSEKIKAGPQRHLLMLFSCKFPKRFKIFTLKLFFSKNCQ